MTIFRKNYMGINMFIIGILGVIGIIMWAMITGGGLAPFIDMPSLAVVFGGSFFAGLAVSKGKLNSETISATGDAAVKIGWIGFLIGLVLMSGSLKDLLASQMIGPAFGVAFLTVLYGYFIKLVCFMYTNSKS